MKKIIFAILIILVLVGCNGKSEEFSADFFAMDTYMSISASGGSAQKAVEQSQKAIFELESLISRTNKNSDIYRLNNSGGNIVEVSEKTYDILTIAFNYAQKTKGDFDPTICAITDLWAIGTQNARVPNQNEIDDALETVSYENIVLYDNNRVQLLNNAQIDLGAVGKGYATDMLVDIYQENKVERGVISLAGNIYVYGEKEDSSLWNIGITDPDDKTQANIAVKTRENSIVTTGAYERYFEQSGKIYHHIFDSKTGYPSDKDIKSVTVISKNSTIADIYATALFNMGYDNAIEFAKDETDIDVVIIKENNEVYISDVLMDCVTLGDKYIDEN